MHLIACSVALCCLTSIDGESAGRSFAVSACFKLEDLNAYSPCELERLYREATPGATPIGCVRGLVLSKPGKKNADRASRRAELFWKGKIFNDCGTGITNILPFGMTGFEARVYRSTSYFDGKESLIVDYGKIGGPPASRDELREIAPGVWLGALFRPGKCGPRFATYFALDARRPVCQTSFAGEADSR